MIPQGLENLILSGKAKHDIWNFSVGSFGNIIVPPDKILIIYQITIFPFTEQIIDRETMENTAPPETTIFQLVMNSEGNREVIPFKFSYHFWEDSRGLQTFKYNYPPIGSAVVLPVYSIHRKTLTFDLRKLILRFCDYGERTVDQVVDGCQGKPFGVDGQSHLKVLDPLGLAPVPVVFQNEQWHNETDMASMQQLKKLEVPADNQSKVTSMSDYFNSMPNSNTNEINTNSTPIILFNGVLANASNFDKLLIR